MRKIVLLAVLAVFTAGSVMAQDAEKPKKKGGLWGAIKKGVESTTGLDVSKEAVFVYPKIGEWTVKVESCTGNKETGVVQLKLIMTRLSGTDATGMDVWLTEAKSNDGTKLGFAERSGFMYKWENGVPQTVVFQPIGGVPATATAITIKFKWGYTDTIEGRDIPVEWQ